MESLLTLIIALGGIATGIGAIWAALAARRQAQITDENLHEHNERARLNLAVDLHFRYSDPFDSPLFLSRRRAAARHLLDHLRDVLADLERERGIEPPTQGWLRHIMEDEAVADEDEVVSGGEPPPRGNDGIRRRSAKWPTSRERTLPRRCSIEPGRRGTPPPATKRGQPWSPRTRRPEGPPVRRFCRPRCRRAEPRPRRRAA